MFQKMVFDCRTELLLQTKVQVRIWCTSIELSLHGETIFQIFNMRCCEYKCKVRLWLENLSFSLTLALLWTCIHEKIKMLNEYSPFFLHHSLSLSLSDKNKPGGWWMWLMPDHRLAPFCLVISNGRSPDSTSSQIWSWSWSWSTTTKLMLCLSLHYQAFYRTISISG